MRLHSESGETRNLASIAAAVKGVSPGVLAAILAALPDAGAPHQRGAVIHLGVGFGAVGTTKRVLHRLAAAGIADEIEIADAARRRPGFPVKLYRKAIAVT